MKMKYCFVPLLTTIAIILTSLSECQNPFSIMADSPISAEINGVLYSSPGHLNRSVYEWPTCAPTEFDLGRRIYYEDGGEVYFKIHIRDTLFINKKYTNAIIRFGSYYVNHPGYVELTDINTKEQRARGKFEFNVKNPETGEIDYKVTNGKFDVEFHYNGSSHFYLI